MKILFLVTEDWYFMSHRADLAQRIVAAGHDVVIGTRINDDGERLEAAGLRGAPIPFERSLRAPWADLAALRAVNRLIRSERPDIVHLVSLKPILIGGLVLLGYPGIRAVAAFTGLGYLFSSSDLRARLIRPAVIALLRGLMRRRQVWTLAQNGDDLGLLLEHAIGRAERSSVVRGAGVDVDVFRPTSAPRVEPPMVLLPARPLADKGVREFVAAARRLKSAGRDVRCVLAGAHDADNPGAIDSAELDAWHAEGVIEWRGHCADMPALYRAATIVCLPSYREGLPKVLLEAAACALPLVASDVPGCREICIDGSTGVSVPARDVDGLVAAIEMLLDDPTRAQELGRNARRLVEAELSITRVAAQTLALYAELHHLPA